METLLPLIRQMLDNFERLGPQASWTGPIARGDYAIVAKHRNALRRYPREFQEAYIALALLSRQASVQRSRRKQIAEAQARAGNFQGGSLVEEASYSCRTHNTRKRFASGGVARPFGALRYGGCLLPDRISPGAAGPQRFCAPVRAHDVPGLGKCGEDGAHPADQFLRRPAKRHDPLRHHQLFRIRSFKCTRARFVAGSGPHARSESGR